MAVRIYSSMSLQRKTKSLSKMHWSVTTSYTIAGLIKLQHGKSMQLGIPFMLEKLNTSIYFTQGKKRRENVFYMVISKRHKLFFLFFSAASISNLIMHAHCLIL